MEHFIQFEGSSRLGEDFIQFEGNFDFLLGKLYLPHPGQEAAGARPSRAQVRNSSSETHLLKTVAWGGAWHSQEDGEEALVTDPNFRPGRHETELGRGSCHREEESEEALATRLPSWARIPPVLPG